MSDSPKTRRKVWLRNIASAFVLAMVTNALWEIAIRPLLWWLWKVLGILMTWGFGDTSLIYRMASRPSEQNLLDSIGIIFTLFTSILLLATSTLRRDLISTDSKPRQRYDMIASIVTMTIIVLVSAQGFWMARGAYLRFNYERVITIAAPILTEQQRLEFNSRFARIQSQADVDAIFADIVKTTAAAGTHPASQPATKP